MFYTGLDPYTMKEVYVAKSSKDKAMQRALLRYFAPESHDLVEQALIKAHRTDLIGYSDKCLIRPSAKQAGQKNNGSNIKKSSKSNSDRSRSAKKNGYGKKKR